MLYDQYSISHKTIGGPTQALSAEKFSLQDLKLEGQHEIWTRSMDDETLPAVL